MSTDPLTAKLPASDDTCVWALVSWFHVLSRHLHHCKLNHTSKTVSNINSVCAQGSSAHTRYMAGTQDCTKQVKIKVGQTIDKRAHTFLRGHGWLGQTQLPSSCVHHHSTRGRQQGDGSSSCMRAHSERSWHHVGCRTCETSLCVQHCCVCSWPVRRQSMGCMFAVKHHPSSPT